MSYVERPQNQWMDRYKSSDPRWAGGLGWPAYQKMLAAGYSNQQIVAGARQRGFTIGGKVAPHLQAGAQPNWMNQYTGSEGNIGLSAYNRMKGAGYNVIDIQRDQPASGMSFGSAARTQMQKDLLAYYQQEAQATAPPAPEPAAAPQFIPPPPPPPPPPKMTTEGAADIGAGSTALGVKTATGPGADLNIGSTGDVFARKNKKNKDKNKDTTNLLPISGITK